MVAPAARLSLSLLPPVALQQVGGGRSGLFFSMAYTFSIVESVDQELPRRWRTSPYAYAYRLLDRHERELLVYHWQPGPDFLGPDHPHLHVSASLQAQVDALTQREIPLDRLHLPTGQVSITALVRALIAEFGVAPLRDDWQEILDRAGAAVSA